MKKAKVLLLLATTSAASVSHADTVLVLGETGFVGYGGSKRLLAFTESEAELNEVPGASQSRAVSRSAPARPEILAAINETGLRYAGHSGVRRADLSALEWLALFRANIEIESAYNPTAKSQVGAFGLGQLMPETARLLGVNPNIMIENLDGSARYLAQMLERFGSKEYALAAYNAGPEAVQRHGGIPPYKETQGHVAKVVGVYDRILSTGE